MMRHFFCLHFPEAFFRAGYEKGVFHFSKKACYVADVAGWKWTCTGFRDKCLVPLPSWPGIVVAPAPDGAVFFQCEGMMGAGRDFDSVGKYPHRCRPVPACFSRHRPDAICPDATVIFEDQDGFVAKGDVGDVVDEFDFDGQGFGGKFLCRFAGQHGVGASPCPEGAVFGDGEAGRCCGSRV